MGRPRKLRDTGGKMKRPVDPLDAIDIDIDIEPETDSVVEDIKDVEDVQDTVDLEEEEDGKETTKETSTEAKARMLVEVQIPVKEKVLRPRCPRCREDRCFIGRRGQSLICPNCRNKVIPE